jgi:tRNA threonylcarbamoyladenosine dehydratase
VLALRERIADIHPGCEVAGGGGVRDRAQLAGAAAAARGRVIDACDQVRAKAALAAWALAGAHPFVSVGAAGGKRLAQRVDVDDLAAVTHDPLLASLRQRLRREHGAARQGRIGLRCVYSREPVASRRPRCLRGSDGTLNCHGYGSSVTVTATFGLVAAGEADRAAAGAGGGGGLTGLAIMRASTARVVSSVGRAADF